jgi:splicing factor 3B subunit 2
MDIRETQPESQQNLKAKQRQKMHPKLGRIDIDYQKLYDAFFKHQTKPLMTRYGELYYEGKEFEAKVTTKRPGEMSAELRGALNIPPNAPPPGLINMQRYRYQFFIFRVTDSTDTALRLHTLI